MLTKKVGIIGAGEIGFNLAEILAIKGFDIVIQNRYHSVDGNASPYWLAKLGKIKDLNDSLQVDGCGEIILSSDLSELDDSFIIVITAGAKRTNPEETREDLAKKNAKIIKNYVELIVKNPETIFMLVSNPVDGLTQFLITEVSRRTGIAIDKIARRIFGISSIDSMRLKSLIREMIYDKYPFLIKEKIDAIVIGEHGPTMVPLMSLAKIGNKFLKEIANKEQIEKIRSETILRGNDIIRLTGASSVSGPAHAAMNMICKLDTEDEFFYPAAVWDGRRVIGNFAKFKGQMFESIINLRLDDYELDKFEESKMAIDKQYNIMTSFES